MIGGKKFNVYYIEIYLEYKFIVASEVNCIQLRIIYCFCFKSFQLNFFDIVRIFLEFVRLWIMIFFWFILPYLTVLSFFFWDDELINFYY